MLISACKEGKIYVEINSFSSKDNTDMDYSLLFGGGAPYIDNGMGEIMGEIICLTM